MKSRNDSEDRRLAGKKLGFRSNLLHRGFEISILIKGIDGVLEVLGGFLLMLVNPVRLNKIVVLLTQHELSEDPHDMIANLILKASREFSVSTQYFGVFYLLSHGFIKLFLVGTLFQKKLWAYPLMIVFLILFIGYQTYRYTYNHSAWLMTLTVFDVAMIVLTWLEHLRIKKVGAK